MSRPSESMSDQQVRLVALSCVHAIRLQADRYDAAVTHFSERMADYELRFSYVQEGTPKAWAKTVSGLTSALTYADMWRVGSEKHLLLVLVAQLVKCARRLRDDGLPLLGDAQFLTHLRNMEEHWEQPNGHSINELRKIVPDIGPGRILYGGPDILIEHTTTLGDIVVWAERVAASVREVAAASGHPLPADDTPLPG